LHRHKELKSIVKLPSLIGLKTLPQDQGSSLAMLDPEIRLQLEEYALRLELSLEHVWVTTTRSEFESWLGRKVSSSMGGAYVYLTSKRRHAILINLARLDPLNTRAIELVVAEELIHMRDFIDGDRRRHSKHGYDRIAQRVADLTGSSLEEIRTCVIPPVRRPIKYQYACPACGVGVGRRKRGTWSCSRCSPVFDQRFVLKLVREIEPSSEGSEFALSIQDYR
jgi:predicted SprT family Zn-dependent metalloprotease